MGLRVNTNIAALTAQRHLAAAGDRLNGNLNRLASGLRIAKAADDAAGLGISERMRSRLRSLTVADRNAKDGLSLAETAEGALQEVNNNLGRMRELAVQSANGTLTTTDRAILDTEYQALLAEINRIASQTSFNGVVLLDGSTTSVSIQVGVNASETISVSLVDVDTTALAIVGTDITTAANASTQIGVLDTAIDTVTTARGTLGAGQNRMLSAITSIASARENLASAESRIRDVDVARETADLARNTILQQAGVSVLAQANTQPQLALALLEG